MRSWPFVQRNKTLPRINTDWTDQELLRIAEIAKDRRKINVRTRDELVVLSFSIWIFWQCRRFWQCFIRITTCPEKIYRKPQQKQAQTNKAVAWSRPDLVHGNGSRRKKRNSRHERKSKSKKLWSVVATMIEQKNTGSQQRKEQPLGINHSAKECAIRICAGQDARPDGLSRNREIRSLAFGMERSHPPESEAVLG